MPTFSIDLLDIFIIAGVAQGFLLLILCFRFFNENSAASALLSGLVLMLVWLQLEFLAIRGVVSIPVPGFYATRFGAWLAIGPLILFYQRALRNPHFTWRKAYYWHFLPFLLFVVILPIFFAWQLHPHAINYGLLVYLRHPDLEYNGWYFFYLFLFPFQLIQNISPDPWGNKRFTLAGTLKVNRNDFGLGEEGEFFHRSIADTVNIQLLMSMAVRNTDRYRMFEAPFAKAIYERMTEKSVKEGLTYYNEHKEKEEDKFVRTAQFLDIFAQRLIQYEELDKAIKVYQYNNELFPDEDFTYSNLAHAFFLKGKKGKALSYSQKALEKNQQNTLAIEICHFLAN